jgi:ATP-dependent DNA helicase DinG
LGAGSKEAVLSDFSYDEYEHDDDDFQEEDHEESIEELFVDLEPHFPFNEVRPEQKIILKNLQRFLTDPEVKCVVIEAPTGVGKSGVALTLANAARSAYILTANKLLQDQYLRDFPDVVTLKGRDNYMCNKEEDEFGKAKSCATASCRVAPPGESSVQRENRKARCDNPMACEFNPAKAKAVAAKTTVFNFAAGLAFLNYGKSFGKRDLLILDEAHNTVPQATTFFEVVLDQDVLRSLGFDHEFPDYSTVEPYRSFITEISDFLNEKMKDSTDGKEINRLETLQRKVANFNIFETSSLVLDKEYSGTPKFLRKVRFTPGDMAPVLPNILFKHGVKSVLLSATILHPELFVKTLGLKPSEMRFLQLDSPFPVENRRISTAYAQYSLSKDNLQQCLPFVNLAVKKILEKHPNDKGIIHGHTYTICKYLYENLRSDRILFPTSARDQAKILREHNESDRPTILLSPSMTEGVDLADDASRVQILVKAPFPYFGDPVLQKRMQLYKDYYNLLTALTIMQAYGRSIRSIEDRAATYFVDRNIEFFIRRNSYLFPGWFLEALPPYRG